MEGAEAQLQWVKEWMEGEVGTASIDPSTRNLTGSEDKKVLGAIGEISFIKLGAI